MDRTAFDRLTVRFATATSRRRLLGRAAKAGAGAAVVVALGRPGRAAAQDCAYGPSQCLPGYVWREAFPGDLVCVEPWVRDQAAADNAGQASRVDPNGAYGPISCLPGYVWRDAYNGDGVCVEPWVRDQAHADNAAAASRVDPACSGGGTCREVGVPCDYDYQCCGASVFCCWDGVSLRTECEDVTAYGGACPI